MTMRRRRGGRGRRRQRERHVDDEDDDDDDAAIQAEETEEEEDIVIGAETGSGKTYAYLVPIVDDILTLKEEKRRRRRRERSVGDGEDGDDKTTTTTKLNFLDDDGYYDYARAIVLVPNKELVQQVVKMATKLAGKNGRDDVDDDEEDGTVRIAVLPGGLNAPSDFKPFRESVGFGGDRPPVDLLVTTPAALAPFGAKPKLVDFFADVRTVVVDEADMLLDGGYVRDLEQVLLGFRRADRLVAGGAAAVGARKTQHVFVAATLPDFGLRSVDAYLSKKFPRAVRVSTSGMHNARHYGLGDAGTVWVQEEDKKGRMERLVELLKTSPEQGGLEGEKVMVFLNSVDDVEGASQALSRAGFPALPFHAKLSLQERATTLERFRKYDAGAAASAGVDDGGGGGGAIPILVCTDLASRGLDIPGVTAIVQLQFAENVVAHLHRMGRCGRAGSRTGRGIVFYGEQESELASVVQEAEQQQERMVLEGDVPELDAPPADDEDQVQPGKVKKAFSRKRGFTKKLKKLRRDQQQQQ